MKEVVALNENIVNAEALPAPGATAKPKKKYKYKSIVTDGIFKENPVFTLMLSLCSALGVTSSLVNSVGLGFIVLSVLILTNSIISLIAKFVPDEIRIPVYITVIASAVTIIEMVVHAFLPDLFAALGVFMALVAVNCIILGRAEAFASKNPIVPSIADAIGNGIGIIIALFTMGLTRELVGTGALSLGAFELRAFPQQYAISLFVQPMGAFLMLGILVGLITTYRMVKNDTKKAAIVAAAAAKKVVPAKS